MKARIPVLLFLMALLFCALSAPATAQAPEPDRAAAASPRLDRNSGLQQDADGLWFREDTGLASASASLAPEASGGPDEFGYTWTDTPLNWIDASGGTDAGISLNNSGSSAIDIGFPFKFYENTFSHAYISRFGYLTFDNNTWNSQSHIPSAEPPNNVVAPHWVPNYGGFNYIRYLRGGAAPNRWFVVEWNDVREGGNSYTFQAVLRENGDIVFQYLTMTTIPSYCQSSGIEDSSGLDGLAVTSFCAYVTPHHAVLIMRPGAAARVNLFPRTQGAFGAPGGTVTFNQIVRNSGELGADTYDLWTDATLLTSLYRADGVTPLTDTDGDGQIDTGLVAQGGSSTIVVKMTLPAGADVGANGQASVTAFSSLNPTKQKTARFQTAVPAAFATSYTQSSKPTIGYYRPGQQTTRQTVAQDSYGYNAAAATLPDGRIVQVWVQGRNLPDNGAWVSELYYALTDNKGNFIRPAARISDLSGASDSAYDSSPAVAVSPSGHIGITWYRSVDNTLNETNYNIYFLVLDRNGDMVVQPTNVTNNSIWFSWSGSTLFELYDAVIAATPDNHFGIAWTRYTSEGSNYAGTTWYAVRSADGGEVRGPTQFSENARSWNPNLTTLADGSLFLTQETQNQLAYGRIDSAGNIVSPLIVSGINYTYSPDTVQLPSGNIVIAWTNGQVGYTVLSAGLQVVHEATPLQKMSPTGDYQVSVTTSGNRAVLTWGDQCCDYMPNLYYALLDQSGNILTPPMIFFSDYGGFYVRLPYNGQGNTPLIGDTLPESKASSPAFAIGSIPVRWSQTGGDVSATRYDVWVRHGVNGVWTKWLENTSATSGAYVAAVPGETVYFRSVARDANGYVETDIPANGDTSTTLAAKEITGQVTNLRGEPIFGAAVAANPAALNVATTDGQGRYHLYFSTSAGNYTLTATKSGFGALPVMHNVNLATTASVDLVLPPAQDLIVNGGFEAGDLRGWQLGQSEGGPAVVASAARTGAYGLRFGDSLVLSQAISQTVVIPATAQAPTFSLYFKSPAGNPAGQFEVVVDDGVAVQTYTAALTPRDWTRVQLNLDQSAGRTVTVTIRVLAVSAGWQLLVDEVSLGEAARGNYPLYLPVIRR